MESVLDFSLNVAMVVLLSATVLYCWILNRRIQTLQDSKSELASLLKQFDKSTRRAMDAMSTLQKVSKEAGKSVQGRIEKAQYVLDDLGYMIDRANKVADQMEAGIAIARQREKIEIQMPKAQPKPAPRSQLQAAPAVVELPRKAVNTKVVAAANVTRPEAGPKTNGGGFSPASVTQVVAQSRQAVDKEMILDYYDEQEEGVISGVTRDSIRKSLRQAKAGGKDSPMALSSIQTLLESIADNKKSGDLVSSARSRGERELMHALQMQAD